MKRVICLVVPGLIAGFLSAAELKIPLTVTESAGQYHFLENVSTGVPLLPGQCKDVKALRILDADGKDVGAQFRELARWWNKDNSIRWVLVDFPATVPSYATRTFTLTDGRTTEPVSPLKVTQTDDSIVVVTGSGEFTINRRNFNLFDRVRIDTDGDGKYGDDEELVSPDPGSGSVVEDTFGQKYFSSAGTTEVKVEEAGPVRVCVAAKGVHKAPEGKGYSRGMYNFDIRMHFFAGKNLVRFDAVVAASGAEPNGSPVFRDCSLLTRLNIEPATVDNAEAKHKDKVALYRVYGQAPLFGELKAGQSMGIYQDSNGAETWRINSGLDHVSGAELGQFRGYQVTLRDAKGAQVLAGGDHARGLVSIGGKRGGVVVVPRYFWEQFPKAIEVGHDGMVRIGLLPREYRTPHWLPDAGGAGMEFWMHFYARGLKGAAKAQYARDNQTRSEWFGLFRDQPWPHVVADSVLPPLVALCPREQYAACGALADIGPYMPVPDSDGVPLAVTERRYLTTDYLKGNAFGWQVFGCRWEEYKGHSPWNYEPIWSTCYLWRAINTQHPTWMEFGWRRNMHTRNVRACKIDGTKPFAYETWDAFRAHNVCEDWCGRAQPKDEEAGRYGQGRYGRAEWYLPNPEHMNLDELYDLYCLFGDNRALEAARNAAAVGGAYVALRKVGIGRDTGWCMRTLMRYRDLTGSDECAEFAKKAVDNFWEVARANRSVAKIAYNNDWFYNVFSRATVLAHEVTGDERMRDLAIGLAQGRTDAKGKFPVQNAFAWDQTGDARYRSEKPEKYVKLGEGGYDDYLPCCNAWLWMKPRPDSQAPSPVTDLAVEAAGPGEARLTWAAPGDDGTEGTAAIYQAKWSDLPVVELAHGGGECSFWAAENVGGETAPKPAGQKESLLVKGLKAGVCHFALKSRDECNNESALSNVVRVEVK